MPESTPTTRPVTFERERGVYDIRVTRGLAHVVVGFGPSADRNGCVQRVFHALADQTVPIFLIKLHHSSVSFAVEETRVTELEKCLAPLSLQSTIRRDLALIAIVAGRMRDLTGIMVSIADCIQTAGARLYGVEDSHNSVQCLLDGEHAEPAIAAFRATFGLDDPV